MHCKEIELKSGKTRWLCVADGPINPVTGKRRQIERRGKTKKEAKKRVGDAIRALEEDKIDQNVVATITFETIANQWMGVYSATEGRKARSIKIRKDNIKILNRYFAKSPVVTITPAMYQNMLLSLAKDGKKGKPYSENTIIGVHACGKMIFKFAKKNRVIKDNPAEDAALPKKAVTVEELENNSIEKTYFEKRELDLFLDAVLEMGLELDEEWFFSLAFSGMRPGELLALKKHDLDFENNKIRVSKTLHTPKNNMKEYFLETTKTNEARVIDMDEKIMTLLKRLVVKNDEHKLKYQTQIDDFHDGSFVFQRPNGYPYINNTLIQRMQRIMKRIDIKKHLTPHAFRHTHISMMTEAGDSLKTIMDKVGHKKPETTLKIYTHATEQMKTKSTKNITALHSDILEKITL